MDTLRLEAVLAPAEGLLIPLGPTPDEAALQRPVTGLEIYQPGTPTDYTDRIVLVMTVIDDAHKLQQIQAECGGAAALVVQPDTAAGLSMTGAPVTPVVLRRSPWVTMDALIRALTSLTRISAHDQTGPAEQAAETLERDAALAVHRRESALLALLQGTTEAAVPAAMLGLRPDLDHVVIASAVVSKDLEALRLSLSVGFPEERSVLSDGVLFSVLPVHSVVAAEALRPGHPVETQARVTDELRARLGRAVHTSEDLPIGVGSVVSGVFSLHESAAVARETLRALKFKLGAPALADARGLRIAGGADVADALALIRAGDALRPHGAALAELLTLLAEYDRVHHSGLLPTVLTALEHRGNLSQAARQLGIHENSLRTRLERIRVLSGIDLNEPVSALRTMVAFLANPGIHNEARS
ncbi:hypothetical protein JOF28_000445 [Leucobacter exalbidus]|uniref:PucR C-terminal helix-turn-helix domain-containing protein n=1 Tax=Leucobacter exalbidus TaxID=662960 RepID=A0A940PR36_9MICO|nr:helix-turn-helix domain-containing protein [Leucobacter exalbidus]MBP1325213.1 hypothetical protein [Leucobacter exalbidus]